MILMMSLRLFTEYDPFWQPNPYLKSMKVDAGDYRFDLEVKAAQNSGLCGSK